ncbi:MAG: YqcI/YcgG family protein [Hydrogenophaga sp.]|uniref:YqcI/YcgG family protein n=1 Tax=Hydrogenophaga sp. TaxID=1904254 RepID=UPI00274F9DB1|nr:YqcI/YcgG family protein [Hydrogenophaga sp.]MDP2417400.1 YqcI/YcgG family protein [Hydrogenophaga sp.]MDZ4186776.1 YqcI/YcgG family protein [Hydrogenophaga sp.]
MITVNDLQDFHPDIWNSLGCIFGGKSKMPCLFATASFSKAVMYFVVVDRLDEVVDRLRNDLIEFSLKMKNAHGLSEKSYSTIVLVSKEPLSALSAEGDFIEKLLIDLHAVDPCQWPEGKTKNMNDQDFEFYWNGVSWFPILLHNTHKEIIRLSDFLMIGFQLGSIFDFNKMERKSFYEAMRSSIHSKISSAYLGDLPFYLTNKSSGKNICQFSGFDRAEHDSCYQYPTLL